MKAKEYDVLKLAVEEGVAYGVNRAFKHTDRPFESEIKREVESAVMASISEWFDFDEVKECKVN